jgi:glucans biosynthesis protein
MEFASVSRRGALGMLSLGALVAMLPRLVAAQPAPVEGEAFSPDILRGLAENLAKKPYRAPVASGDKRGGGGLAGLSYDEYFRIRFRGEHALWADRAAPFRAEFFPPAYLYPRVFPIYEVEGGVARPVPFDPEMFDVPGEHAGAAKAIGGFSGLRLLWPLNRADKLDEIAVFQGASYFRSLGRDQFYGLSSRGLAIGAGEPNEEFPSFERFWLERPADGAETVVVHALMDSPSCTGAYSFTIRPGQAVTFDVTATIFPRVKMTKMGVAAQSSMFLFNVSDGPRGDDFRTAVHDSDGLAMLTGTGEQIWRPLTNPTAHRLSYFQDENPRGFGLVQRARRLEDYGDLEARYDLRPSLWVEPLGAWGKGAVVLAELATRKESDDNIAVFWRPEQAWEAGSRVDLSYRLHWGGERLGDGEARVVRTRTGADAQDGLRMFTIDLSGPMLADGLDGVRLDIEAKGGETTWSNITPYPRAATVRAAFGLKPVGKQAELSLRLTRDGKPISETWRYLWTA